MLVLTSGCLLRREWPVQELREEMTPAAGGDGRGKLVRRRADLLRVAAEAAVDEDAAAAAERALRRESPQHLGLCAAVARGALTLGHPQLQLWPDRWRTPHAVLRNPKLFTQVHARICRCRGRQQKPACTRRCVTACRGTRGTGHDRLLQVISSSTC